MVVTMCTSQENLAQLVVVLKIKSVLQNNYDVLVLNGQIPYNFFRNADFHSKLITCGHQVLSVIEVPRATCMLKKVEIK